MACEVFGRRDTQYHWQRDGLGLATRKVQPLSTATLLFDQSSAARIASAASAGEPPSSTWCEITSIII